MNIFKKEDLVEKCAIAIYEAAPGIGGDNENGWVAQSDQYKRRCRDIARVVIKTFRHDAADLIEAQAREIEGLKEALGKIGRMKTTPDHTVNIFTLSLCREIADEALAPKDTPNV